MPIEIYLAKPFSYWKPLEQLKLSAFCSKVISAYYNQVIKTLFLVIYNLYQVPSSDLQIYTFYF